MKRKITALLLIITMTLTLTGCMEYTTTLSSENTTDSTEEDAEPITFDAMFYDNSGNNYMTFKGNKFNITPNKTKQWGYETDGTWTSWWETSSVVSIEIDGNYVQTCGSSVVFKDSRINVMPLTEDIGTMDTTESGYETNVQTSNVVDNTSLILWWSKNHEVGQNGSKLVVIQSQDGYNIGVVSGKDVTWEVAESLPKTTLITIDDMPLYIHRCNFSIIDTKLFDKMN